MDNEEFNELIRYTPPGTELLDWQDVYLLKKQIEIGKMLANHYAHLSLTEACELFKNHTDG